MPEIVLTMKLHLHPDEKAKTEFREMTESYRDACNLISEYIFNNGFILNSNSVQKEMYRTVRDGFGLKAQLAVSTFKTVTARYKAVKKQMADNPYKYKDGKGKWIYVKRTLE